MKSHSIAYSTWWKWTSMIMDFGPWRWSALNMGFVDKWPSRMQGQWFFWSWVGRSKVFGHVRKILISFLGGLPLPISTSLEMLVKGRFNVYLLLADHVLVQELSLCGFGFLRSWLIVLWEHFDSMRRWRRLSATLGSGFCFASSHRHVLRV